MKGFSESPLLAGQRALLLTPDAPAANLAALVHRWALELKERLQEHGAILFRGFGVASTEEFQSFIRATSLATLNYVHRSTPRTNVGSNIFTATEYPAAEEILLHNENAYQREWPLKVAFCCLTPAASGGETPIGDMRSVTAMIGEQLLDKFESRGVRYVRHYRSYMDLAWQTVFQTDDRAAVERFCATNDIEFQWVDEETLRTAHVSQGAARHVGTGERIFFNQAHLFHISSLPNATANSLLQVFAKDELPRHATYGDGGEIAPDELDRIRTAFKTNALVFPWHKGDILLLDNMQVAHGRRPFKGERKVLAALLDSSAQAALNI